MTFLNIREHKQVLLEAHVAAHFSALRGPGGLLSGFPFTIIMSTWGANQYVAFKATHASVDEVAAPIRAFLGKIRGDDKAIDPWAVKGYPSEGRMKMLAEWLKVYVGAGHGYIVLVGAGAAAYGSNIERPDAVKLLEQVIIPGLLKDREKGRLP